MNTTKIGIALTGFAAVFALLALTPASASFLNTDNADSPVLFGMAELTHRNADGDIVASSTVHNRLLNYGEGILVRAAFFDTPENVDVLCISEHRGEIIGPANDGPPGTGNLTAEALEASAFDPSVAFAGPTVTAFPVCVNANSTEPIATAADNSSSAIQLTGTFRPGVNIMADQVIRSLAICTNGTAPSNPDLTTCATAGNLFAAVDVDDTTVRAADSVEVTYTFNLTSPYN